MRKPLLRIRQPFSNHNGGQIAFGPNGRLYIGAGDGGSGGDPNNVSQKLSSRLGKMLTLNVNVAKPKAKIVRLARVTRGASASTARRATSTSPTLARTASRRSTS